MELLIVLVFIAILAIIILKARGANRPNAENDAEIRRAGRRGEIAAANAYGLKDTPFLFTETVLWTVNICFRA